MEYERVNESEGFLGGKGPRGWAFGGKQNTACKNVGMSVVKLIY